MSWTNMVVKKAVGGEVVYDIHEVGFDKESGDVQWWTENSILGGYESVEEMKEHLEMLLDDISKGEVVTERWLKEKSKNS